MVRAGPFLLWVLARKDTGRVTREHFWNFWYLQHTHTHTWDVVFPESLAVDSFELCLAVRVVFWNGICMSLGFISGSSCFLLSVSCRHTVNVFIAECVNGPVARKMRHVEFQARMRKEQVQ